MRKQDKIFSAIISEVESFDEHVMITKNGKLTAVIVSADEWAEIEETAFWRSVPGIIDEIAEAVPAPASAWTTISLKEPCARNDLSG